ncbi:DNA sulfur modification protein DndB [Geomonas azotofigens]|uniref:DNA sulfur modification protein DndB n=1 Tax=Geomonas azotofigens TaxID=2843196 RepID=UPI001C104532|nr:DNA sulfur modification protein DndB [Geomonas azotofigens]MBU5612631.1 DNA sulfur modification protein DndB [Geomonas azotofigens]
MDTNSTLSFPVIRGLQARREYYVAMWTLRMLRQISIFDEDELPPELRAQRILNKGRIPEISDYILNNPDDYVFSALTVSIDSEVVFEALPGQDRLGVLRVPMDAHFIINDGQHRRAAIIEALKQRPELEHETIAVVFFLDIGLERCQQMFADLNRYAIRPSRSLGLLYDHRNDKARLAKLVIMKSEVFRELVDMEKSSLAPRSRKLFTLSAFYNACADLVNGIATGDLTEDANIARSFWEAIAEHFPQWLQVRDGKLPASEVREGFIHSHGIAIQAIGKAGNALLLNSPNNWRKRLKGLEQIDWSRKNAKLWEGRALIGGKVSKVTTNVVLTTNVIKRALSLPISEEEQRVETAFNRKDLANE